MPDNQLNPFPYIGVVALRAWNFQKISFLRVSSFSLKQFSSDLRQLVGNDFKYKRDVKLNYLLNFDMF